MDLNISPFTSRDLSSLEALQPQGWSSIIPHFNFYLESNFCFPIKLERKAKVIGIGATILHGSTAWLAHIIVSPENRNQGIGKIITESLVDSLKNTACTTILLIATKPGETVYKKVGFTVEMEYAYYKGVRPISITQTKEITPFNTTFEDAVLQLDKSISGENREKLLRPHLQKSSLIIENGLVTGCFFSTLGEGLILAENNDAGLALLSTRYQNELRAALPINNNYCNNFLIQNAFVEVGRGIRMRLGMKIEWQPEKIYNRIGGNLG